MVVISVLVLGYTIVNGSRTGSENLKRAIVSFMCLAMLGLYGVSTKFDGDRQQEYVEFIDNVSYIEAVCDYEYDHDKRGPIGNAESWWQVKRERNEDGSPTTSKTRPVGTLNNCLSQTAQFTPDEIAEFDKNGIAPPRYSIGSAQWILQTGNRIAQVAGGLALVTADLDIEAPNQRDQNRKLGCENYINVLNRRSNEVRRAVLNRQPDSFDSAVDGEYRILRAISDLWLISFYPTSAYGALGTSPVAEDVYCRLLEAQVEHPGQQAFITLDAAAGPNCNFRPAIVQGDGIPDPVSRTATFVINFPTDEGLRDKEGNRCGQWEQAALGLPAGLTQTEATEERDLLVPAGIIPKIEADICILEFTTNCEPEFGRRRTDDEVVAAAERLSNFFTILTQYYTPEQTVTSNEDPFGNTDGGAGPHAIWQPALMYLCGLDNIAQHRKQYDEVGDNWGGRQ